MTNGKYGKYVKDIRRAQELVIKSHEGKIRIPPSRWDIKCFPENTHWIEFFYVYAPGAGIGIPFPETIKGFDGKEVDLSEGGGHKHDFDEIFLFFGTNPDDPDDLGGEVECWLGEGDEAEKFIINKPTGFFIPAGLVHNPTIFRKVDRLIIWMVIATTPNYRIIGDASKLPTAFKL